MHVDDVKDRLKMISYMAATCDIWSCKHRYYIAVNINYIDPTTYEAKSFLIAIDRFEGAHNNVTVTNKLKEIFRKYDIFGKVVGVTTDNASEFVLGFIRFGDNYRKFEEYLIERDESDIEVEPSSNRANRMRNDANAIIVASDDDNGMYLDDDSDTDSDALIVNSLPPILIESVDQSVLELEHQKRIDAARFSNHFNQMSVSASASIDSTSTTQSNSIGENNSDTNFRLIPIDIDFHASNADDVNNNSELLPERFKCGAHTLNLVGKNDALKALSSTDYASIYCRTIAKLNLLWKNAGQNKNSTIIQQYLGKLVKRPHKIRWNALYTAVSIDSFFQFNSILFISFAHSQFHFNHL